MPKEGREREEEARTQWTEKKAQREVKDGRRDGKWVRNQLASDEKTGKKKLIEKQEDRAQSEGKEK